MLEKKEIVRNSNGQFKKGENFLNLSEKEIMDMIELYNNGESLLSLSKIVKHSPVNIRDIFIKRGMHIKNQTDYLGGKTYEELYGDSKSKQIKEKQIGNLMKGKTYEEIYGLEKAKQIAKKQKDSNLKTWERPEIREKLLGKNNPFYGKKHKGEALKKVQANNEFMTGKTYEQLHGVENANKKKENMSNSMLEHYKNETVEHKEQRAKAISAVKKDRIRRGLLNPMKGNSHCSKPELLLKEIIERNNLPFNHVGTGQIYFNGPNYSFNPDFLSKNPKHIIEVFGDYWHNTPQALVKDKERLSTYSKYGYKTLIIWEHELMDRHGKIVVNEIQILNKIKEFLIC